MTMRIRSAERRVCSSMIEDAAGMMMRTSRNHYERARAGGRLLLVSRLVVTEPSTTAVA